MKINNVLKQELEMICISKEAEIRLNRDSKEIVSKIKRSGKGIDVKVGGSLAKGTLINKKTQDVDIFVVFKSEEDSNKLGGLLRKAKLGGKLKLVHGSRDYFQISKDGVVYEIIPVVEVRSGNAENAENVTDVSLMHVNYVKKKISKNKKLASEIKLAKAFCFANDCYGAESYIKGFSGYALEVLVIYFKGFVKFLKGVQKKKVIDPKKYFKSEQEILRELNASKLQSPIVLVDPTYKYRNVAAGLGDETFDKFLKASKKFLKTPTIKSFEKRNIEKSVENMKKFAKSKKAKFLEINLKTDKQEGDIAGTKMKKFFGFIIKQLERQNQKVLKKDFVYSGEGQKAKCYFVIKENKEIELGGISLNMKQAIKNFKKAHKKTFIRGGKVYAKKKISIQEIFIKLMTYQKEMSVRLELV